ncbi:hypothetical protein JJB09_24030 [Rhizobium sp. KVB221]|uniref:Uncharacterized protein n=1 Tax=Rhizobium setariae TaxID=2801340 RepID=A0A936YWI5_9HYPH|nr:hypothetical protein [Rhizobium setariae]MBL0375087.1 hypothetical protein [Rhizobium setariae]
MFDPRLPYPASVVAGKNRLSADDVLLLRRHMFPMGLLTTGDAELLWTIHCASVERSCEWEAWFVEQMAEFVVVRCHPQYALDDHNAGWLLGNFASDDAISDSVALEVCLHAMELAADVPDMLSALILDQLRLVFAGGKGAYAKGRAAKRAGIASCDIDFIYRILRGSVHKGKMLLSQREIAVLDAIDVLVQNEINHPAWADLMRSIAARDSNGHASPVPWLQMLLREMQDMDAA